MTTHITAVKIATATHRLSPKNIILPTNGAKRYVKKTATTNGANISLERYKKKTTVKNNNIDNTKPFVSNLSFMG